MNRKEGQNGNCLNLILNVKRACLTPVFGFDSIIYNPLHDNINSFFCLLNNDNGNVCEECNFALS